MASYDGFLVVGVCAVAGVVGVRSAHDVVVRALSFIGVVVVLGLGCVVVCAVALLLSFIFLGHGFLRDRCRISRQTHVGLKGIGVVIYP